MDTREESRGVGDLLGDLGRQVSTLVRKEIDLARVELTSNIRGFSRGAAMVGAGGVVLYAGLLVLLAAIVFALIEAGMDGWLAALIVAVVTLAIGGVLLWMGVKQIQNTEMAPKQTAETVQENVEFVKEQMK
jgi:threonine/homoserine/homoserine lactone efflux protein